METLFILLISSSESPTLEEFEPRFNMSTSGTHDSSASSSINSDDLTTFLTGRGLGRLKIIQLRILTDGEGSKDEGDR